MQVVYTPRAVKDMRALPPADRAALERKLIDYALTGQSDVVRLQGSASFRLRHGQWRAIFDIRDGVIVLRIAHRREVYR